MRFVAVSSQWRAIGPRALAAKQPKSSHVVWIGICNARNGDSKMNKFMLGAAALAAMAAPAFAADMQPRPYTKAPAYTAPQVVYNWTGFYVGGHVGGAFAGNNSLQGSDARFLGGVQGGFDYQFAPNWVMGAEAQYSWLP